jgi:heme exporter protein C
LSTSFRNNPLLSLGVLASVLVVAAIVLVFFYAPVDEDGLNQKIFYFHVPIALTAYAAFGWAALKALLYLWKGDEERDLESYVAVHIGVIFGLMTLVTGSIWARISWGVWWEWGDRQLVLFLVLFLFYAAYFMLRFSIEPGPQRASISAVYALFGVVLIPISFLAIRLADSLIHPVTFTRNGPQMAGSQFGTFLVCLAAIVSLGYSLYRIELAGKRIDARLRELKELLA